MLQMDDIPLAPDAYKLVKVDYDALANRKPTFKRGRKQRHHLLARGQTPEQKPANLMADLVVDSHRV